MGWFDELAEQADALRWRLFAAGLPRPSRRPPDPDDGFLPSAEAAVVMRCDEDELMLMVRRGWLEGRAVRGRMLVRPAALTRLGISVPDTVA